MLQRKKWDAICKADEDRQAVAKKKKKKESDDREAAAKKKKKQCGQNKTDDIQYEIEAIVGHELGSKSKNVIMLRINRVRDDQTTLESVKVIKETAWVIVE